MGIFGLSTLKIFLLAAMLVNRTIIIKSSQEAALWPENDLLFYVDLSLYS